MELGFTEDQEQLRWEVRQFLDEELAMGNFEPQCDAWVEVCDPEFSKRLANRGWIGLTLPEKYGGQGRSPLDRLVLTEELQDASFIGIDKKESDHQENVDKNPDTADYFQQQRGENHQGYRSEQGDQINKQHRPSRNDFASFFFNHRSSLKSDIIMILRRYHKKGFIIFADF